MTGIWSDSPASGFIILTFLLPPLGANNLRIRNNLLVIGILLSDFYLLPIITQTHRGEGQGRILFESTQKVDDMASYRGERPRNGH